MFYGELADHDGPTNSLRVLSSSTMGSILENDERACPAAYSEMSLGLDDIMCSSTLDGSIKDIKTIGSGGGNGRKMFSPSLRRRSSIERSDKSNYSEMSMSLGLDDLCSAMDGAVMDGGGTHPMPCLNEVSREFELSSGAGGGSCFFNLGEDEEDDDDYYLQNDRKEDEDGVNNNNHKKHTHGEIDDRLRRLDDSKLNRMSFLANQSLINWTSYEPDNRERKVSFSNNEPDVRSFPKPPMEENSTLFYDSKELQEMLDEFIEEERSSRLTIIR